MARFQPQNESCVWEDMVQAIVHVGKVRFDIMHGHVGVAFVWIDVPGACKRVVGVDVPEFAQSLRVLGESTGFDMLRLSCDRFIPSKNVWDSVLL